MFQKMIETLKAQQKKIVFTEGSDPRILEAATRLHREGILAPVLLGNVEEIKTIAQKHGWSVEGIEMIDPLGCLQSEQMASALYDVRKGKMELEECRKVLTQANYFGTMMVKLGMADGLLGGATYSTADTVRPALQIVKTKPGNKIVSSCFIMNRVTKNGDERYAMADCAINIDPTDDELVEIATETVCTARLFEIDPKVALLSYSSFGSGKGASVDKMRSATAKLKAMDLNFPVDGELQFDAAFAPEVAKTKAPTSLVAGKANVFIFPDIDAGNIGYKIGQRFGGFDAYGPILQGLNAPINDLSRGCNAEEVYKMSIITAAMAL